MKLDVGMEFVSPPEAMIEIDGQALRITPITVGELPALLKALEPAIDELLLFDPGLLAGGVESAADLAALLGLVSRQTGNLTQAVAVASRQPLAWVQGLLADRFAHLAAACIGVNRDFFVQAGPGLKRLLGGMAGNEKSIDNWRSPSGGTSPSASS